MAMPLTTHLRYLAIPYTLLQTGNAGADDERQNRYSC
jgi:hypothetical protein